MSDSRWDSLRLELKKDWWGDQEAMYICAGLIVRNLYDPDQHFTVIDAEARAKDNRNKIKNALREVQENLFTLWRATDHNPPNWGFDDNDVMRVVSNIRVEWKKEYVLRWAQVKDIEIPWFDWAVEEGFIDPLDVTQGYSSHGVTDNGNTGANRMPENKQMGKTERENLVRLIGILRNMLKDDTVISDLKRSKDLFKETKDLTAHISGLYKEDRENKGLGPTKLNTIWAEAKKILKKDEDF